jgi:cell division protein ZapA
MADSKAVTIRIRGQEFRIRTDEDEDFLQRVAQYLDETMGIVEKQTGTVDSLQLAILSALNVARELVEIREGRVPGDELSGIDPARVQGLIELVETELGAGATEY